MSRIRADRMPTFEIDGWTISFRIRASRSMNERANKSLESIKLIAELLELGW